MSYKVEKATIDDLTDIAKLSYDNFGAADVLNKTADPIKDREQMFFNLLSFNENILFKITAEVEKDHEPSNQLVAYSSLIPLKKVAFEDIKTGNLNHYRFRVDHILTETEIKEVKSEEKLFCYYQAIVAKEDNRGNYYFQKALRELVIEHFCNLIKGCKCDNYEVLAEEYTNEGKNLLTTWGFKKLDWKSATNHNIWLLDSQNPSYPWTLKKDLNYILNEIKRIDRLLIDINKRRMR